VVIGSGRSTCDAWVVEFMETGDPLVPRKSDRQGMDPAERERIAQKLGFTIPSKRPILGPTES